MRNNFLIGLFFLSIIILTSCSSPENMKEQIANTYESLGSLQYKITVTIEDTYVEPYTAYEIVAGELGEEHTLTGSASIETILYQIKKPNKKIITSSGNQKESITGGQSIGETWYWQYEPARDIAESKLICNDLNYRLTPENSIDTLTHPQRCSENIETELITILSNINDPTQFDVNLRSQGDQILVDVKKIDNSLIEISGFNIEFDNITIWLNEEDFTLNKLEGTQTKSKKGGSILVPDRGYSEEIGLKSEYFVTFSEILFNPDFADEMFELN